MVNKYRSMNIEEIKKILLKKGFKISRLRRNKNYAKYRSVYISAFVSLFLIGTFAILPSIFNIFSDTFKKNNVV